MTDDYDVVRCSFCGDVVTMTTIAGHKCPGRLKLDLLHYEALAEEARRSIDDLSKRSRA